LPGFEPELVEPVGLELEPESEPDLLVLDDDPLPEEPEGLLDEPEPLEDPEDLSEELDELEEPEPEEPELEEPEPEPFEDPFVPGIMAPAKGSPPWPISHGVFSLGTAPLYGNAFALPWALASVAAYS
jgi:hypothetical protein